MSQINDRWNHNTHYYPLALRATPCTRALDVGCGDGLLLRLLAPRCESVVGVDPWADAARATCADLANVTVIGADFLMADLAPGSFDLVTSYAAIHHLDFEAALTRMAALVAPGGRLVIVSLARYTPWSWVTGGLAIVPHRLMARRRGLWQHPAPIADPTMTLGDVRRAVRAVRPGATVRRRLYWRYSITWTR